MIFVVVWVSRVLGCLGLYFCVCVYVCWEDERNTFISIGVISRWGDGRDNKPKVHSRLSTHWLGQCLGRMRNFMGLGGGDWPPRGEARIGRR